jgi:hypothetical protein
MVLVLSAGLNMPRNTANLERVSEKDFGKLIKHPHLYLETMVYRACFHSTPRINMCTCLCTTSEASISFYSEQCNKVRLHKRTTDTRRLRDRRVDS